MRPTITVDRIPGSVTRIVDAVRSQSVSTEEVLRGCARGRYLGGSDLTGVGSITANPSWTDMCGK